MVSICFVLRLEVSSGNITSMFQIEWILGILTLEKCSPVSVPGGVFLQ